MFLIFIVKVKNRSHFNFKNFRNLNQATAIRCSEDFYIDQSIVKTIATFYAGVYAFDSSIGLHGGCKINVHAN